MDADLTAYLAWRKSGQMACVFARYLAVEHSGHGQRWRVIRTPVEQLAGEIAAAIAEDVGDPDVLVSAVIMPEVNSLGALVKVATALGSESDWRLAQVTLPETPAGASVAFQLTRMVRRVDGVQVPSEVLVMGPFVEFPITRRAPRTALEIFVGVSPLVDAKTQKPTDRGNLAQLNLEEALPSEHVQQVMWDRTKHDRLKLLGDREDPRAKARVSFVVPDVAEGNGTGKEPT
jgi:hypothetical protein